MSEGRGLMGNYEILQDFELDEASLLIVRVDAGLRIDPHLHRHTTQIYVALEGDLLVEQDDTSRHLEPFETVRVPANVVHRARPAGETAVLMNISIPRLTADDQLTPPAPPDLEGA